MSIKTDPSPSVSLLPSSTRGKLKFDLYRYVIIVFYNRSLQTYFKHKPLWYEPTDLNKVLKIFECGTQWQKVLYFVSPNINELMAIAKHFEIPVPKSEINLEIIKKVAEHLNKWIPVIITTLGAQGVLVTRKSSKHEPFLDACKHLVETSGVQSHLYTPLRYDREILSVSGCGDCLAAGIITGILRGWKESSSILLGLHAARESLSSFETVPNTLKSLSNMQDFYISTFRK